jgi:hypothetical protein
MPLADVVVLIAGAITLTAAMIAVIKWTYNETGVFRLIIPILVSHRPVGTPSATLQAVWENGVTHLPEDGMNQMRTTRLLAFFAVITLSFHSLTAQDVDQGVKRDALHKALVAPLNDAGQRHLVGQQIDQLNDAQVDRLFKGLVARIQQLEEIQQRLLAREQAAWNHMRQDQWLRAQMIQNRAWGNRSVGYRPIITWLPEGTNMTARAVVSPDLRHVRISLNPFFSRIGSVDTFNYHTGQTRRIYTPSYPGSGSRMQGGGGTAPVQQSRPVPEWYRRIRTIR